MNEQASFIPHKHANFPRRTRPLPKHVGWSCFGASSKEKSRLRVHSQPRSSTPHKTARATRFAHTTHKHLSSLRSTAMYMPPLTRWPADLACCLTCLIRFSELTFSTFAERCFFTSLTTKKPYERATS